ncbi:hypothetical protein OIU77_004082 [Salix suchowensis]|uniref:Uncharacterized protein n=1 Tax=Salix suchowensis TaxID=1278906 RepID=A0ABQ9AT95_9ROSI|nr:hypothetical protein OIU77_004082 [Salix suchowensis]
MILSPPTGGTHMVQADDTADRQAAALETTSSRNWNFPRKLNVKTLKEVNVEPQRIWRRKPSSPNRNPAKHESFKFPPPPMSLYCPSCR